MGYAVNDPPPQSHQKLRANHKSGPYILWKTLYRNCRVYNYNPIGAWGDRGKLKDEGNGASFLTRHGAKIARQTIHDGDGIVLFMACF